MTLDNLLRLKEHFRKLANNELMMQTASGPKPYLKAERDRATLMLQKTEERIKKKLEHENYKDHPLNQKQEKPKAEEPEQPKEDGKKPKR